MAFIRICSGKFHRNMSLFHVRSGKNVVVRNAMTFFARDRSIVEHAWPGDIIGVPNHGTIRIADTFTEGEPLEFTALPKFAPELFRRARLEDPMAAKALGKGLQQLCEEGAAQLFRPAAGSHYIIGALGALQFDVIAARMQDEYKVAVRFEDSALTMCRWVLIDSDAVRQTFERRYAHALYHDERGYLCLLTRDKFHPALLADPDPHIRFVDTMELA
jgi:peptide chain release factor 3